MSMLYSFVARGSIILSKYAACQGNFEQVALDCLEKLSGTESRFTVKAQEHMLHFLVDGGLTYLLIAEESCSREICFYYLEQIQTEFKSKFGDKAKTASANAFDRQFSSRLKYHMEYCMNNPGEISKIHRVKAKVDEVKGIMVQNIERVLERGERIEVIVDKTEDLQNQADQFRRQGRDLRNKMWWQNMKMKALVAAAIILLILILFFSICFGGKGNCLKRD